MDTDYEISPDIANIDWWRLADIMARAPLHQRKPFEWAMAFRNSYAAVFAYGAGELVGAARATSDGVFYASIFDVAVAPEHQRRGVGRLMIEGLLAQLPVERVFLTSVFGRAPFYEKFGFLRQNNAMGLYAEPVRSAAIANGVLTSRKNTSFTEKPDTD